MLDVLRDTHPLLRNLSSAEMKPAILSFTSALLAGVSAQHGITAFTGYVCNTPFNAEINSIPIEHEFSDQCFGFWYKKQKCQGPAVSAFSSLDR